MNFIECTIVTSEEAIEAMSEFLRHLGAEGVVIEDAEIWRRKWKLPYGEMIALDEIDYPKKGARVKGYFMEDEPIEQYIQQLEEHLIRLPEFSLDPGEGVVKTKRILAEDWQEKWKTYYHSVQISPTMLVKPSWENTITNSEQVVIDLDPGISFGTGTHPTTIQVLRLMEKELNSGDHVIDIGCGSGVLSIAAAKLGASRVLALDLDPVAVKSTQKNILLNDVHERIEICVGDLLTGVSETTNCVVANLLAEIIQQMVYDLPRVLRPGGVAILAGILVEREERVLSTLQHAGLRVVERVQDGEWVAIVAKKW